MEGKDFGRLMRTITANVNHYIGSKIERYGIKYGQFEYFLLIYSSPGINQLELARLKNVGKASVTKALKILEDGGYIQRIQDEKDKRNTLCYVTESGERIVEDLLYVKTNTENDLFKGLETEDKAKLYGYLQLICENSAALAEGVQSEIEED